MIKRVNQDQIKSNPKKHFVLVNNKTGKVASSNNWLNTMAALAISNDDSTGIMSALPLVKARNLLRHNKVTKKSQRSKSQNKRPEREKARDQAISILPHLAVLFERGLPRSRPPRINEFCLWITHKLEDRNSEAHKYAENKGFHDLIDARRSARWWQDQIKKMQS